MHTGSFVREMPMSDLSITVGHQDKSKDLLPPVVHREKLTEWLNITEAEISHNKDKMTAKQPASGEILEMLSKFRNGLLNPAENDLDSEEDEDVDDTTDEDEDDEPEDEDACEDDEEQARLQHKLDIIYRLYL